MTLPRTVADVIRHHVTWELESIDRMYCNIYVPQLQREGDVVGLRRAGVVVAINKNPKAPIFKAADLGIVSDYAPLLPLLEGALGGV